MVMFGFLVYFLSFLKCVCFPSFYQLFSRSSSFTFSCPDHLFMLVLVLLGHASTTDIFIHLWNVVI